MAGRHDPGALLAQYHALARGPRVCLRLVRRRDLTGISDLYARQGIPVHQLSLARLVSFDLLSQLVLCATALIDATETIVGIGAIELDRPGEPKLVVVDEDATEGLAELLSDALVAHATAVRSAA
ncbi:MAG TPA: hypothetical protein VHV28_00985 [Solirubrobacteraceae bacterium]|jgi:hypothetical protein|nr:hypothetical protein [Solirubrobacteraceae bacterium]